MELGAFSVSLAVKDIEASKRFYEKLGFTVVAGDQSQNWLIMRNGDHTIGLFQGMFEKNILTFNPGGIARHSHSKNLPMFEIYSGILKRRAFIQFQKLTKIPQVPEVSWFWIQMAMQF